MGWMDGKHGEIVFDWDLGFWVCGGEGGGACGARSRRRRWRTMDEKEDGGGGSVWEGLGCFREWDGGGVND